MNTTRERRSWFAIPTWTEICASEDAAIAYLNDESWKPACPDSEIVPVTELLPGDVILSGDEAEEIRVSIANFKLQVETHRGDYLPGNFKQLVNALDLLAKKMEQK